MKKLLWIGALSALLLVACSDEADKEPIEAEEVIVEEEAKENVKEEMIEKEANETVDAANEPQIDTSFLNMPNQ